jgi:hypothetical protein
MERAVELWSDPFYWAYPHAMLRTLVLLALLQSVLVSASSQGFCPQLPPSPSHFVPAERGGSVPPMEGAEYLGTLTMFSVISDKGFVCDVKVLDGIDDQIDQRGLTAVRDWQFTPAEKDGRRISVVATFGVNVWRKDDQTLFQQAGKPNPQ